MQSKTMQHVKAVPPLWISVMPQDSGMGGWNALFSVSKMKTVSRLFCNESHL